MATGVVLGMLGPAPRFCGTTFTPRCADGTHECIPLSLAFSLYALGRVYTGIPVLEICYSACLRLLLQSADIIMRLVLVYCYANLIYI